MGKLITTEGIVLESRPYKERDRLVKVLTEKAGKQMLFVRNSLTPKFQYYQAIQPLAQANYILDVERQRLSYLKAVKEVKTYQQIQLDLAKKAYAIYFANLVDLAASEQEADPTLYGLFKQALVCLEEGLDTEVISFIFELQMLKRFGVMPVLTECVLCHENNLQKVYDYSQEYGGIICSKHFNDNIRRYHAHPRAIYYIRRFLNVDLKELKMIDLSFETKNLIREVIDQFYDDYVGLKLKSRKFIDEMKEIEQILKR